jgi:hypothetical protein
LPAAAYLVRSIVLRGGDFAPDVPQDVIALVVFTIGVSAYVVARRRLTDDTDPDADSEEHQHLDDAEGQASKSD